jgi:hypothetical protein
MGQKETSTDITVGASSITSANATRRLATRVTTSEKDD